MLPRPPPAAAPPPSAAAVVRVAMRLLSRWQLYTCTVCAALLELVLSFDEWLSDARQVPPLPELPAVHGKSCRTICQHCRWCCCISPAVLLLTRAFVDQINFVPLIIH